MVFLTFTVPSSSYGGQPRTIANLQLGDFEVLNQLKSPRFFPSFFTVQKEKEQALVKPQEEMFKRVFIPLAP